MNKEQEQLKQPSENLEATKEQKSKNTMADILEYIEFEMEILRQPGHGAEPGGLNEGYSIIIKRIEPILRQLSQEGGMQSIKEAMERLADQAFKLEDAGPTEPNEVKFYDLMSARKYLEQHQDIDFDKFEQSDPALHKWRQGRREAEQKRIQEQEAIEQSKTAEKIKEMRHQLGIAESEKENK